MAFYYLKQRETTHCSDCPSIVHLIEDLSILNQLDDPRALDYNEQHIFYKFSLKIPGESIRCEA